tara:strand:+ start:144 stop:467 length:324 start_codon:yes stop_codon:yes gene_type:complete
MKAEIKLTKTMLEKHIIDANKSVRELVKPMGVDYEAMKAGDKQELDAIYSDGTVTKVNFYRTKNARADRRISIKGIKAHADIGDVVVLSCIDDSKEKILIRINEYED